MGNRDVLCIPSTKAILTSPQLKYYASFQLAAEIPPIKLKTRRRKQFTLRRERIAGSEGNSSKKNNRLKRSARK
jgi:hypothetical protein